MGYKARLNGAEAPTESMTSTAALREAMLRDRLRLHALAAPNAALGAVLAASVFLLLVGKPLTDGAVACWVGALLAVLSVRLALARAWRRHRLATTAWLLAHRVAFLVHGLVWAAAAWLWLPRAESPQWLALLLVLAAVGAAGLVSVSFDFAAGIVFTGTLMSPVLGLLLFGPGLTATAARPGMTGAGGLALALVLLLALMLLAASRSATFVHKALRARLAVRESLLKAESHAAALRQSEESLRTHAFAVNSIAEAVSVVHRDRGYVMVNDAWCEITGVPREQALGRQPSDVLGTAYVSQERRRALAACLEEQRSTRVVSPYAGRDGLVRQLETAYYPYREAGAATVQAVSTTRDITREVEDREAIARALAVVQSSEAEQRRLRDEAEAANRAKSQFLANMSHELRTPLNAIVGFGQVLLRDVAVSLAAPQREHVQEMLRGAYHLLDLINEVLDLGRIEAGRLVIETESVPVAALIDECFALVLPLARERGVTLLPLAGPGAGAVALADGTIDAVALADNTIEAVALADRVRLKQVLLNLLSNAIKYNRPHGEVEVTLDAQTRPGRLRIEVRDTGHGLDEAARARLFRPFERLGAERGDAEGTGIGLALSEGLVRAMGGRIGVASEPGQGSRFWIELSAAGSVGARMAMAAGATVAAGDAGNAQGGGVAADAATPLADAPAAATVLYIDDNTVNLTLMQAMLSLVPGLRLLCSESPGEGLRLAERERPDLVLLDIQLPGMDGFEVRARLRDMGALADVPVVAVSANAMPADIEAARRAGFAEYLTKPVDLQHLHATVHRLLVARRGAAAAP